MRTYWNAARAPRYSILLALPLFLLYEVLVLATTRGSGGVRNGAEVILDAPFLAVFGWRGPLLLIALLIAIGAWLVLRDLKRSGAPLRPGIFAAMLAEAAVLAVLVGYVIGGVTSHLLTPPALMGPRDVEDLSGATRLMLSLGAGLYEELLFRVVLVGAMAWIGRVLLGWKLLADVIAVAVGAVVFSAFHYLGPYGDRWQLYSFVYRALAGAFFSALYVTRGFGITAWTHALYDIIVMVG